MIPHSIEKIKRARAFLDANGREDAEIEVDGNVSIENARAMLAAGADFFIVFVLIIVSYCATDIIPR